MIKLESGDRHFRLLLTGKKILDIASFYPSLPGKQDILLT